MGGNTTNPIKRLGAWLVRVNNTVYQAATDGFALGIVPSTTCGATDASLHGYTDGANPPTTQRKQNGSPNASVAGVALCMPVKKNDYWKIQHTGSTGTPTIYWIPLEP